MELDCHLLLGYHFVMGEALDQLISLVQKLRRECPWDRIQTFQSLRNSIIQEAYEAKEASEANSPDRLREELGDLLVLILMNSEIARGDGLFDIEDVARKACRKLESRHPHVFGSDNLGSAEDVRNSWEKSKLKEGGSLLDGVPSSLPVLMLACTVQERAARVGFDWENLDDVFRKVEEELGELKEVKTAALQDARLEEFGDLLFSVVNVSRFLDVDPEEALRKTVEKFRRRFRSIEKELAKMGRNTNEATLSEMDKLWNEAKEREKDV